MSRILEDALQKLGEAVTFLSKASIADDLTPLANAIALRRIGKDVGTTREAPDVVVFGDLNRFKRLNDEHGHEAGDAAISHVGQVIDTLLVKGVGCRGFRRSGDEFVLLTTVERIEDLRASLKTFAGCRFQCNGKFHSVGMSFGLAKADGKADFHELMERAETACQTAKVKGEGELVEWNEELEAQSSRSIRGRCGKCDTRITCDVPVRALAGGQAVLKRCPVCDELLT
jgi:diguanylate cyclase (GGDEF)-like protein